MAPPPSPDEASAVLREQLRSRGLAIAEITALRGDVSMRRYFRVTFEAGDTAILASYPTELLPACRCFERSTELLESVGVRVPRIRFSDCRNGLMLVEDLGDRTLYGLADRGWDELSPYLERAAEISRSIATLPIESVAPLNAALDRELLAGELTRTWRLLPGNRGPLPGSLPTGLADALDTMLDALTEEPLVPCHRDFMARNLIPVGESPGLAVLDHQDLRLGPPSYDLASLLNDSLYPPESIEETLVAAVFPLPEQRLGYHRSAAQRTLKAVGTFLAFARRGFDRYRPLIPPSLERARRHLEALPEFRALSDEIARTCERLLNVLPPRGPTSGIC